MDNWKNYSDAVIRYRSLKKLVKKATPIEKPKGKSETELLRELADNYQPSGGGGMPDPSGYDDGTILVKVGDGWKAQSGYGYSSEAFPKITWDGNTEGKELLDISGITMYKISDEPVDSENLLGGKIIATFSDGTTEEYDITEESIREIDDGLFMVESQYALVSHSDTVIEGITIHKGIYFQKEENYYFSSLSSPLTVQTIDPILIPSGGGLPEVEGDGKSLVSVEGQWVEQSGYAYSNELEYIHPITTDPEEFPQEDLDAYFFVNVAPVPELPDGFGINSSTTLWYFAGDDPEESDTISVDYANDGVYAAGIEEQPYYFIVTEDDATVSIFGGYATITFPNKGVYLSMNKEDTEVLLTVSGFAFGADQTTKLISWDGSLGEVVKFDAKYIPDTIATKAYVDEKIAEALAQLQ